MINPDYQALCAELVEKLHEHTCLYEGHESELVTRARALLAQPEPEGPTDDELLAMRSWSSHGHTFDSDLVDYARAVLTRWGRPTPRPVAVSERLPGPEDCDEQGRCWVGGGQLVSGSPTWILGYSAWASRFPDVHYCWLPANALPTPETNV